MHGLLDAQALIGGGEDGGAGLADELPGDADLYRVERLVGREVPGRRPIGAQRDASAGLGDVLDAVEQVLARSPVAGRQVLDGVGVRRHPVGRELCDDAEIGEATAVRIGHVYQVSDGVAAIALGVGGDGGLDRVERGACGALPAGVHVHVEPGGVDLGDELTPLLLGER